MKSLIKIMLTLSLLFLSTFFILQFTGVLTKENIEVWLLALKSSASVFIILLIIGLLFADLFIAVPTLTVMILAGFFLGAQLGAVASIIGLLLAGTCGYVISYKFGERIMKLILKDANDREDAISTFRRHGPVVVLLSRALPILPEVSACMAGMTRMPFARFLALWLISTVPYALIATYAGSISSLENPKPAIITAIMLTAFFWCGWMIFKRTTKNTSVELTDLATNLKES